MVGLEAFGDHLRGVLLREGLVGDRDQRRQLFTREIGVDGVKGALAVVRVALHADREVTGGDLLDGLLLAVDRTDVELLGETGLLKRLERTQRHPVVVGVDRVDFGAEPGDPVGHQLLAAGQREVAVLRIEQHEALFRVDNVMEAVVPFDRRRRAGRPAELDVVDRAGGVGDEPVADFLAFPDEIRDDRGNEVDAPFALTRPVDFDHRYTGGERAIRRGPQRIDLARRDDDQVAFRSDEIGDVADLLVGVAVRVGRFEVVLAGARLGLGLHAALLGEAPSIVEFALRKADQVFRFLGDRRRRLVRVGGGKCGCCAQTERQGGRRAEGGRQPQKLRTVDAARFEVAENGGNVTQERLLLYERAALKTGATPFRPSKRVDVMLYRGYVQRQKKVFYTSLSYSRPFAGAQAAVPDSRFRGAY